MESEKEFEGERKKTFREVFGTNARRAGANRNKRNEEKGKMKPYWMGLDIGGTKCAVLLATVDGGIHLKDKLRFETQSERGFEPVYAQLTETMDEILRKNGLTYADLNAVGVSCGGPLDSRRGAVLCPPNLPGWVNIPLKAMLEERCGVPVYLQNDANACALVEWKLGAGRGCSDMIFLTMGTGMGGGIIAEGKLLRGCTDMGGEIGHLRLEKEGPVGFGKAGSFEGFTSGGGIQRQARALTEKMVREGRTPAWVRDGHGPEEADAKLLAAYARTGDADAKAFFDHIGTMLGKGLALLTDTLNPEKIVIGSIFVRCEDLLRPAMEAELKREAIPFSLEGVQVVPAQTGETLGDLASIMAALYGCDVDPMEETSEREPRVLEQYERLFHRYPALDGLRGSVMEAYLLLRGCYSRGGKLLIVGNGGSCADAGHIVGELMKGFYLKRPFPEEKRAAIAAQTESLLPGTAELLQQALPAIDLTQHGALSTAVQNDLEPLLTAAQQVAGYGKPGDVVLGISTSGNAKNVALAVGVAKALGLSTIGLTGGSGGQLKELCDCAIIVPAHTPADVQEYHLPIYHTLCAMLEEKFFGETEK